MRPGRLLPCAPGASPSSRMRAAGPGGGEPQQQDARLGIPEAGDRARPVVAVAEAGHLLPPHALPPFDESGTAPAGDEFPVQLRERQRSNPSRAAVRRARPSDEPRNSLSGSGSSITSLTAPLRRT